MVFGNNQLMMKTLLASLSCIFFLQGFMPYLNLPIFLLISDQ